MNKFQPLIIILITLINIEYISQVRRCNSQNARLIIYKNTYIESINKDEKQRKSNENHITNVVPIIYDKRKLKKSNEIDQGIMSYLKVNETAFNVIKRFYAGIVGNTNENNIIEPSLGNQDVNIDKDFNIEEVSANDIKVKTNKSNNSFITTSDIITLLFGDNSNNIFENDNLQKSLYKNLTNINSIDNVYKMMPDFLNRKLSTNGNIKNSLDDNKNGYISSLEYSYFKQNSKNEFTNLKNVSSVLLNLALLENSNRKLIRKEKGIGKRQMERINIVKKFIKENLPKRTLRTRKLKSGETRKWYTKLGRPKWNQTRAKRTKKPTYGTFASKYNKPGFIPTIIRK